MNPQQLYEAVPTGGNGLIDGSFEARYSLSDSWRLAGFVDFGQVTTGLVKPSDIPNMLWAVGIGIRYITSIGPIRLDLARLLPVGTPPTLYRLDDVTGEPVPVPYQQDWSCFGLFASRPPPPNMMPVQMDSACALQISIGEAY